MRILQPRTAFAPLPTGLTRRTRARIVAARSQPFNELKHWQRRQLEAAAELSKKKMNVKELSGDLQMSREEVLYFVNWLRSLPKETREAMRESIQAAESAVAERKTSLQKSETVGEATEKLTFQEVNDLKASKRRQAITTRQQESLEQIYTSGTTYPSKDMVQEISKLVGVHRGAVRAWFEARRGKR